jgi:proteasome accessory factor C
MSSGGRRTAEERLSRLLVMLPWLMEQGEVPLADVAHRYGMSVADVARDLELAAMCGLPPFVDEMIDVFIDDDTVFVGVPRLFTRPLRLSAPEGFALVAAGRAAMQLPGADPHGPLGRGLAKLAAALGDDAVVVDLPISPALAATIDVLRAAITSAERLQVDYWTPSRDEVSARTITPRQVFNDRGEWYVVADDGRSGERRTFRVDRIESIGHTGEHDAVERAPVPVGERDWFADAGLRRVTLRLSPGARWVVERYPVDDVVERRGGVVDATFPVASERWLERLLVRLGPDAEVRKPAAWRALGSDVARRVLARYAESGIGGVGGIGE